MMKKVYFASDFHFGIPDKIKSRKREDLFVQWLEEVKIDASEIYLMGDLFDFWFEYKTAVPKGYVRLFGKLADLNDSGVRVHLFRGNHDMWAFDYLAEELNIQLHTEPEIVQHNGKLIYLAHGDGLGPGDHGYKMIKRIFRNKVNQWLFRWMHPDIGIKLALFWSRKSRYASEIKESEDDKYNLKKIRERLIVHSKEILKKNPEIRWFVYGHYHLPFEEALSNHTRIVVLGDWLTHFSYAVFDGESLQIKKVTMNR